MKVRLDEAQLMNVISECIKKVLNEMDQDVYTRAADRARELGQHERAMRFNTHAETIAQERATKYVTGVSRYYITYKNSQGNVWNISANAKTDEKDYIYNVNDLADDSVPGFLRTTDVRTAKYVADWCNRYSLDKKDFTKNDFIA